MAASAMPIMIGAQMRTTDPEFTRISARLHLSEKQLLEIYRATTTDELSDLILFMDDYIPESSQSNWLTTPLPAFAKLTPRQLILQGRTHELLVETERLREGIPV